MRGFEFTASVKKEARLRQWEVCAHCSHSLTDVWEEAHHVVPKQIGRANDRADAFVRSADNCVILCDQCHVAAHEYGRTARGAVRPPEWYVYSHGKHQNAEHEIWLHLITREWQRLAARERPDV
jgi:5-methylcytosine-specific restriction endonuclease McrA